MTSTPHACGASQCTKAAVTGWIDTMDMTPHGHRQYLVCAEHRDRLADRKPVRLVRPLL